LISSSNTITNETELSQSDAQLVIEGDDFAQWFSTSVQVVSHSRDKETRRYILGGAPTFNHNNQAALGKVFFYDITKLDNPTLVFVINGSSIQGKLGMAVASGNPYPIDKPEDLFIVLAAPSSEVLDIGLQGGKAYFLEASKLSGNFTIDQLRHKTTFLSDEDFARLGYDILLEDINGDLIDDFVISQPWKRTTPSDNRTADAGRLFGYFGGNGFPKDEVFEPLKKSDFCFEAKDLHALFGSVMSTVSGFRQRNQVGKDLLISSPLSSRFSQQAGLVTLIVLTNL